MCFGCYGDLIILYKSMIQKWMYFKGELSKFLKTVNLLLM